LYSSGDPAEHAPSTACEQLLAHVAPLPQISVISYHKVGNWNAHILKEKMSVKEVTSELSVIVKEGCYIIKMKTCLLVQLNCHKPATLDVCVHYIYRRDRK